MDKKAKKGYLVGYNGKECYRIYVPEEKCVYLSRDVIFQGKLQDYVERLKIIFSNKLIKNNTESCNSDNEQGERRSESESQLS